MLSTEFRSDLFWMGVTKYQRYLNCFFNLFFDMSVRLKLNRYFYTFFLAMIRVTEGTVELSFNNEFLVLTLNHKGFHTFTAGGFFTAFQNDRLSIFEIEVVLAERTF